MGEDVTNDLFACDFINTFVPASPFVGTAPAAMLRFRKGSRTSRARRPPPAQPTTAKSARAPRWRTGKADRLAKARKAVPVDRDVLASYAGGYRQPHRMITVSEEGGRPYVDVPQGDRSELFAETPTQFFLKIRPWTLTFVKEAGQVVRLDILDSGEIVSGQKVD